MIEVVRENLLFLVELDRDDSREHLPHTSWGTYRVIDRRKDQVLFVTPNRDKSFGVFEYVTKELR